MVISAGMMLSVAANAGSGRVRIQESTTETTTKELPSTGRGIKGLREELKSELSSEATTKTEITSEATTESVQITTVVETSTQATTARTDMPAAVDENGEPLTGDALKAYNIVANTFKDKWTSELNVDPSISVVHNDDMYTATEKCFKFPGGNVYAITRFRFNKNSEERLEQTIEIPGSQIQIRYIDNDTSRWYMSSDIKNTEKQTLFIDTDQAHYIISLPSVYSNKFENGTLEAKPELEEKINIEKSESGYTLKYSYPVDTSLIGEIWYLKSDKALVDWTKSEQFKVLHQDLSVTRRISWDGYYFPTPDTYTPYSETMFYRQPSDYPGAAFTKDATFPAAYDLGYVFTYTCMQNQDATGFWPTPPKSGWLAKDFNIGANFYDTRFNTDFGENLLYAYKRYNNSKFLYAAVRYCEYFIHHAENYGYETQNKGVLVQDYGYHFTHTNTHVSLNHQLAELIFLYKVYQITHEVRYKELADKMLQGVIDTQSQWVLPSGNLNYALFYTSDTNTMVDYPFLTYNDLKHTKEIYYEIYKKEVSTIEYLMNCKMQWMIENNVTDYEK